MSSGVPRRPIGICNNTGLLLISLSADKPGVSIWTGLKTFTRIPRPFRSMIQLRVKRTAACWHRRLDEQDIDAACPLLNGFVEQVNIGELRSVAWNGGDLAADLSNRLIQFRSAKRLAAPMPMPPLPPVTTATLFPSFLSITPLKSGSSRDIS
jgi:hypothetical protein